MVRIFVLRFDKISCFRFDFLFFWNLKKKLGVIVMISLYFFILIRNDESNVMLSFSFLVIQKLLLLNSIVKGDRD